MRLVFQVFLVFTICPSANDSNESSEVVVDSQSFICALNHCWHVSCVLMSECHESDACGQHSLLSDEGQPPLLDTEGSHVQRWVSMHSKTGIFLW